MKNRSGKRGGVVGVYGPGDRRLENRELALKLVFRELAALKNKGVEAIFKRWGIREVEVGTTLSIGLDFPKGLKRNQWFYEKGATIVREIK